MKTKLLLLGLLLAMLLALPQSATTTFADIDNPSPHEIEWGNRLTANDSDFYYTSDKSGDDVAPCDSFPQFYKFGTLPIGGSINDNVNILTGCDSPQASVMVADDTTLYYVESFFNSVSGTLYKMPLDGSSDPSIMLTGFQVDKSALAQDELYVYFALPAVQGSKPSIWRITKNTLIFSKVVDLNDVEGQINKFALDDNYVYWTEGEALNEGAVRAVNKNGGAIFTAADAGVENAWDIEVSGEYVYWTEIGGRVRRLLKSGGSIETLYNSPSDDPIYTLVVGDDNGMVYFGMGYQNGSLWRVPVTGGTAILMRYDETAPQNMHLGGNYIYWTSGKVKRLSRYETATGVDYAPTFMEVTQGIQSLTNDTRLVAGKDTVVRVYGVETEGGADKKVSGQLSIFNSGGTLVKTVTASSKGDLPGPGFPDRGNMNESIDFLVPGRFITDGFGLSVEINADKTAFELNYDNNSYPVGGGVRTFSAETRTACLITWAVFADDGNGNGTFFSGLFGSDSEIEDYERHIRINETLLPAVVQETTYPVMLVKDIVALTDVLDILVPYNMVIGDDREQLKSDMTAAKDWSDLPDGCDASTTTWGGLVDNGANTVDLDVDDDGILGEEGDSFTYGGQGWSGPQVMWTRIREGGASVTDYNSPRGGMTLVHEVGHVMGRAHVDCNNPADPDPMYPYDDPCSIGDSDDAAAQWGFDPITMQPLNPLTTRDYMAYGEAKWISPYTWNAIYDRLEQSGRRAAAPAAPAGDSEIFWLRGLIDLDSGKTQLFPAYHLPFSELTSNQREVYADSQVPTNFIFGYEVLQFNALGQTLAKAYISIEAHDETEHTEEEAASFTVADDLHPDTTTLKLIETATDTVLATIDTTPAAPVVSFPLVTTNSTNDTMTIDWNASDADGDDMFFMMQYSYDGDKRRAIAIDQKVTSASEALEISTAALSGKRDNGAARVKIFVSDGFNTTMVTSGRIIVEEHRPTATILEPRADATLDPNEPLILRGVGRDVEDGELPDEDLHWFINGEMVGIGRSLPMSDVTEFPAEEIHSVELRVTDSDQMRDSARAQFGVAPTAVMLTTAIAQVNHTSVIGLMLAVALVGTCLSLRKRHV